MRWNVSYGDVPLYKYYYEVRAYEKTGCNLVTNKLLESDSALSGYQTIKAGVVSNYELDSAEKVKKHIRGRYQQYFGGYKRR